MEVRTVYMFITVYTLVTHVCAHARKDRYIQLHVVSCQSQVLLIYERTQTLQYPFSYKR